MTYNIRYATERDGINSWENRKEWVVDQLKETKPDVFGIQEGLHHQVEYLDSALTDYAYVGVGRDDGATGGEYTAIFYQTQNLSVLEHDTFWLSESPDTVSVGWDASMERITTWARFKSLESNKEFVVFNVHLDHIGEESRLNSLKLIRSFIEENIEKDLPVIVMGDLNAVPESEPINYLNWVMNDAWDVSKIKSEGPVGTFHGFDPNHPLENRIDYIFVNSAIEVESYEAIFARDNGFFPSDHLPVLVNFTMQ
ncbi:MAG: endonuclease/exonuclease/phosphatase family protein [Balneolaceae bacterium]|nr:endonuclease/exonuclease/phosphatase family protein [Balneolaceae bacterium]